MAINPPSAVNEDDSIAEAFDISSDGYGMEVLNGLCRKVCDFHDHEIFYSSLSMRRISAIFRIQFYFIWQVVNILAYPILSLKR